MSAKNYKLVKGDCSDCDLLDNCGDNKIPLTEFLKSLKLECGDGLTVKVLNEVKS